MFLFSFKVKSLTIYFMKTKYIIGGIVIILGIVFIANYQNIFKSIIPPKPVIVSENADGSSSKLFDYSIKVFGELRNDGGDGYVVIEATVSQEDHEWKKTQQMYLQAYQTEKFELVFDEVKFLDANPVYSVKTYALGSLTQ